MYHSIRTTTPSDDFIAIVPINDDVIATPTNQVSPLLLEDYCPHMLRHLSQTIVQLSHLRTEHSNCLQSSAPFPAHFLWGGGQGCCHGYHGVFEALDQHDSDT